MDIVQLYLDFGIPIAPEGHHHYRPGWVNTECPFCISEPGHIGYHLGYETDANYYVCWRCGWHPVSLTIATLLNIPERQVRELVRRYGIMVPSLSKTPVVRVQEIDFKLPYGVEDLKASHKKYLIKRNFDPEEIVQTWQIKSIGPSGKLKLKDKEIDYKHRILIPIIWNSSTVSFDTRDVTNLHRSKYMACPLENEIIPHKEILYCKQEALQDTGIIVEGYTDVWRFGVNSVATSGIKYTPKQVRLIAKMFKRTPVCFDGGEPQAKVQANKLVAELKFRGVDAFRIDIEGDPGSMKQSDADYLVKQLMK
jgi:hypothetical protein